MLKLAMMGFRFNTLGTTSLMNQELCVIKSEVREPVLANSSGFIASKTQYCWFNRNELKYIEKRQERQAWRCE